MNAVAIEGQCRITEQGGRRRCASRHPSPGRFTAGGRRRRRKGRRRLVYDVMFFAHVHLAGQGYQFVLHGHEDQITGATLFVLHAEDARDLAHRDSERNRPQERHTPTRPHTVGKRYGWQETTARRMTVAAQRIRRQAFEEIDPVPQGRQRLAVADFFGRIIDGRRHQAGLADRNHILVAARIANPGS